MNTLQNNKKIEKNSALDYGLAANKRVSAVNHQELLEGARDLVTFTEYTVCHSKYVEYASGCCLASFQGDFDG
jgi:hypothetical protein